METVLEITVIGPIPERPSSNRPTNMSDMKTSADIG